ncbi:MAG: fibronectin type III domain-containing protein, partial [Candidatus Lokiarchaeota archaeon]|nr:fibronectin type III domain-containing protein [Candidatus Lokiarchaeota archaeon]
KSWNATTNAWTATEVVSTESTAYSGEPSLAVDGSGNVHVAWRDLTDYDSSGSDNDIFYKRWNATTNAWTATEVVSPGSPDWSGHPSLVVDGSGNVHITWYDQTDFGGSGADQDIFYRHWDVALGSWTAIELVSNDSTAPAQFPSIAVDGSGNVHVAWDDPTNYDASGNDEDIFYKRWNATTGAWTATEVVSTESTAFSGYSSIVVDKDGCVHVAWADYTDCLSSGEDMDIFCKHWNATTGAWTATEVVSTESTALSCSPSLVMDDSGNLHVVWHDFSNIHGAGTDYDVFYKRLVIPPDPPALSITTASPTLSLTINLTWTTVANATTYSLYRHSAQITPGNFASATAINTTAGTSFNDVVSGPGTYWYAVIARGVYSWSALSNSPCIVVYQRIYVDGNAQLDAVANVGNGTISNPYIIEDKIIGACGNGSAIYVRNTNAHVIINNCTVFDSGSSSYDSGIRLENVTNIVVMACNSSFNYFGIALIGSTNNTLNATTVKNNTLGIFSFDSSGNVISFNNVEHNPQNGIQLATSSVNHVHHNIVSYNGGGTGETGGIFLWGSTAAANIIEDNLVMENNVGISFRGSGSGNIIRCNSIINSSFEATRYTNGPGPNTFYWNNFIDNAAITTTNVAADTWDNGYPDGGNYFDPYAGSDGNHGPSQNLTGGDNFGDTPFGLAGAQDRYPLMYPFNGTHPNKLKAPNQIADLSVLTGNGHVNLTWTEPNNGGTAITGYNLYWSTDNVAFSKISLGAITSYQHSGLTNGLMYYYKLAAVNVIGSSVNSTVVYGAPGLPCPVSGLIAVPGTRFVNLTWTAPWDGGVDITGYNLYWSLDNTTFTRIALGAIFSYQHTGLANHQVYYYMVAAMNAVGEGTNSSVASATTWDYPGQVTDLVIMPGYGHANLTWTAPWDGGVAITGYNLYWSTDNATFTRISLGTVTSYNHSGLACYQLYHYKVAAVNVVGEGTNSSVASATTWDYPGRVMGIIATPGNQYVDLAWSVPSDSGLAITGYNVYWSTDNLTFTWVYHWNLTFFHHAGLTNGLVYHYKVAAVNVVGEGTNSSVVTMTPGIPGQVMIRAIMSGDGCVNLTWVASGFGGATITGYNLYWSTDNTTFSKISLGAVTSHHHSGLTNGQVYYYKVAAVNAFGEGISSATMSTLPLSPTPATGVPEIVLYLTIGVMGASAFVTFLLGRFSISWSTKVKKRRD